MKTRIVEVTSDGLTVAGTVRLMGERVEIPAAEYIPSPEEQIARWGEIKVQEYDPDAVPEEAATPHRPWEEMDPMELGNLCAGFSDEELAKFRVWAEEQAELGNTAAIQVLAALDGQ